MPGKNYRKCTGLKAKEEETKEQEKEGENNGGASIDENTAS